MFAQFSPPVQKFPYHPFAKDTAEYSPALPMGWVPGVKPRAMGLEHRPLGNVLTVSVVGTSQCQTPTPGIPRPRSTCLLGIGNAWRGVARMANKASLPLRHTSPTHTKGVPHHLHPRAMC